MPTIVIKGEGGVDSNGDSLADKPDIVHKVVDAHSPGCEGWRAR